MHQAVGPSVVALREWYPQFKPKSTDACALDFDHSLHTTPCGGGSNTSTANSTSTTTSTLYRYRYRYRWWIPCRGRDRRHAIQAYIIYIMIDDILILMYIYIYIISFDANKPLYMYMYLHMISSFYTFICMFKRAKVHHTSTPQGCAVTTILTGEVDPCHRHRWCLSGWRLVEERISQRIPHIMYT